MTTPERILIIKSSSMGDIIHALPVAHDIRRALPQARIDWVAEESFRDIPTLSPAVANVRVTAFRRWRKAIFSGATRAEAAALRAELAGEHYDCVLDIQGLMRSALVARWTGVPSIGYTWGTIREPLASLAYARHLNLPESLGAVRRYRMAAAEALGYSIDPDRPVFGLRASGTPPARAAGRTVSFAVNTSRDEKLWPEARWIELGLALLAEGLTPILYWGSAAEEARAKRIALAIPGAIVAPRARLSDVAAGLGGSVEALVTPMQFASGMFRAMSPVAGVIIAVAGAAGVTPMAIVRRTWIPMVAGIVTTLAVNQALFG